MIKPPVSVNASITARLADLIGGLLVCASLWLVVPAVAQTVVHPGESVSKFSEIVSPDWHVLMRAEGDLNRDGEADIAAVLEAIGPGGEPNSCDGGDDYSDAPARLLVVLLHQPAGGYSVAVADSKLVLRRDQGGILGDPLQAISIDRGSLLIEHYGGSRQRWGYATRFRLSDADWQMIGYTESTFDTATGEMTIYDYNPLISKVKRTVMQAFEGQNTSRIQICVQCRVAETCPKTGACYAGQKAILPGETWYRVTRMPLVTLVNFRCWKENTGFFAHTGFVPQ